MNRPILLVVFCLVLPLAACALLNSAETDRAPLFPGFEDPALRSDAQTTDPMQGLPTLEEMAAERRVRELELRVELVTYELARAIIENRAPQTALNPVNLNEAFAAMFKRPEDPESMPRVEWYFQFKELVTDMSGNEVSLYITSAEDPIFAKHPSAKKAWRSAHVFIRVERVMKDGKKRSSGIILSAPEPEEKRTSFPVDDEEDVLPSAPTLSPLGQ